MSLEISSILLHFKSCDVLPMMVLIFNFGVCVR